MRSALRSLGLVIAPLALCLVAAAPIGNPADPFAQRPDASPFAIRELLRAGNTAELERRLEDWRTRRDERRLRDAYWALSHLPGPESRVLDAWLAASPTSAAAHLAAALQELGRAEAARGKLPAAQVSEQQWQEMRAHAQRALALAADLLRLDPTQIRAYELRMEIARLTGDAALRGESLAAALALDPADFGIWLERLSGARRRWGGSYEELEQLAREAQAYASTNPQLRELLAMPLADQAHDLHDMGRRADALALYDAALEQGQLAWIHHWRGHLHFDLGNFERAEADFSRAILLGDPIPEIHFDRSRALFELKRRAEGLAAREMAAALDHQHSYDAILAETRAWAADQDRWDAFLRDPNLADGFEYALRFAFEYYAEGLTTAVIAWALWRAWLRLRRRGSESAPPPAQFRAPAHPDQPAMVAMLLRSVLIVIVLHHVWIYAIDSSDSDPLTHALDLSITAIGLAGALAYASGRRVGRPALWRVWAVLLPSWNVVLHFVIGGATFAEWPAWGFVHLELLPVYGSLFAYGFAARAIWDEDPLVGTARAPAA